MSFCLLFLHNVPEHFYWGESKYPGTQANRQSCRQQQPWVGRLTECLFPPRTAGVLWVCENLGASSWNSVSTQSLAFLKLRIDTKNSNALPFNSTLEITEPFPFPTCERVNGIDADGNPTDYRTRVGKYFLQNPLMIDIHASSLKPLSSAKAISLQPTGGQLYRIES